MAAFHGVYQNEAPTPLSIPREAESSMPVFVGVFPVHRLDDPKAAVDIPWLWNGYPEAIADTGNCAPDEWTMFPGAMCVDSQLRLHGIVPAGGINVWDPLDGTQADVADVALPVVNGVATITDAMAIKSTVEVVIPAGAEKGVDYTLTYAPNNKHLRVTAISGGLITPATLSVTVTYQQAAMPDENDLKTLLLGGVDINTNKRTGIEQIEEIWLKYGKVPAFLWCQMADSKPEIAAALMAKGRNIDGGNFEAISMIDVPSDTDQMASYRNLNEWKNSNGYSDPLMFLQWPAVAIGDSVYSLAARAIGKYGEIDADNFGIPYVQISNKSLMMTKMCRPDGTQIPLLNSTAATYLANEVGIGTVKNDAGWRFWDDDSSAVPGSTDIRETDRAVRRMFTWAKNSVNLMLRIDSVDRPMNKILIDSILAKVNDRMDAWRANHGILGGRIEFLKADNVRGDLLAGKLHFQVYFSPSPTARAIMLTWQYDPDYLDALWA